MLLWCAADAAAQEDSPPPLQVYAGYSRISNSFNGVPGAQNALNGWNAGVAFQPWHRVRFKLDYSIFRGTNAGAPQHGFFILGGGQYEAAFHRERIFAEALVGDGGLNGNWYQANAAGYKNGNTGTIASFAEFLGGGADTPVVADTRRFELRAGFSTRVLCLLSLRHFLSRTMSTAFRTTLGAFRWE